LSESPTISPRSSGDFYFYPSFNTFNDKIFRTRLSERLVEVGKKLDNKLRKRPTVEDLREKNIIIDQFKKKKLKVIDVLTNFLTYERRLVPECKLSFEQQFEQLRLHQQMQNDIQQQQIRQQNELKFMQSKFLAPNDEFMNLIDGLVIPEEELELGAMVGRGKYGYVFRATYRRRDVAVKRIQVASREMRLKTFMREVSCLKALSHSPTTVKMIGVCISQSFSIVLEFVDGGSLHDLLLKKKASLTLIQQLAILRDIASAMNDLHSLEPPILHRDLTLPNVLLRSQLFSTTYHSFLNPNGGLLSRSNSGSCSACANPTNSSLSTGCTNISCSSSMSANPCRVACLTDFGIAGFQKEHGPQPLTPVGRLRYMAPEVIRKESYTKKADQFMFGYLMYELFTLRKPFHEYTSEEAAERVKKGEFPSIPTCIGVEAFPPLVRKLMLRCWKQKPKKRPAFQEIVRQLDSMLKAAAITASKQSNSFSNNNNMNNNDHLRQLHDDTGLAFLQKTASQTLPQLENNKNDDDDNNNNNNNNIHDELSNCDKLAVKMKTGIFTLRINSTVPISLQS